MRIFNQYYLVYGQRNVHNSNHSPTYADMTYISNSGAYRDRCEFFFFQHNKKILTESYTNTVYEKKRKKNSKKLERKNVFLQ